jgi:uncharacterized protein YceK
MRKLLSSLICLALSGLCGCGTIQNVERADARVYGGFRMTCYEFCGGGGQNAGFATLVVWPFWLLDKPLSLVGDTLTIPYVIWLKMNVPTNASPETPATANPVPVPKSNDG